ALVLYDFLITFGEEVRLFWGRKFTGASLLFFINRYWTLLANDIFMPLSFARVSDNVRSHALPSTCDALTKASLAVEVFQYVPWAGKPFSGLRVLALSGMNWPLSVITFLLAMGPVGVNLVRTKCNQIYYCRR
ncbi:hypothetical protein C8Q79DRAFT_920930, partial [Trametes meyenii]